MYETIIKSPTFIFICIQTVVFIFQLANFLSRIQDKSRLRFLILIGLFIFYNFCSGLFPDKGIPIHLLVQNIFAFGSGIVLAMYYFYYLVKELNIAKEKLFNIKLLFISLVGSFILGFICTYILSGSIQLSKQVFIIPPILISIYFCISTIRFIVTDNRKKAENTPYKLMVYSGYIGIVFMATMSVVVFVGNYQILINSLVNVSFGLAFFAYLNYYLYQRRIEDEILYKAGHFSAHSDKENEPLSLLNFNLTASELNIAFHIITGMKFKEIAKAMYITVNTATRHGSTIYKKTGCKDKKEFISKFRLTNESIPILDYTKLQNAV